MRPTPARSAIVTRLTPDGATLARAGGASVLPGTTVTDGETLILATPTGNGGAVTLDRRGVALRLTTVRLPPVFVGVTLASSTAPASVEETAAVRAPLDATTPEAPPVVKPADAPAPRTRPITNEDSDK